MALIREESLQNGCRWAVWRIEENIDELLQISRNSKQRQMAIQNLPHERRKLEYLATRLLIDKLTETDIEISYLASGKPILADTIYQISLSHTAGYAAAVVHPTNSPGIDIEAISSRIIRVQNKFLNDNELANIDPQNLVKHLLIQWSAKECVYKAMGEEGVDFRNDMQVSSFKPKEEGFFTIRTSRTTLRSYTIQYFTTPEFVLTLTV